LNWKGKARSEKRELGLRTRKLEFRKMKVGSSEIKVEFAKRKIEFTKTKEVGSKNATRTSPFGYQFDTTVPFLGCQVFQQYGCI
jgi:hypothetical protein